ncbi:hypothetical protein N665_0830s0027 [Sinapis alba]|nr:hypothetical protein N665_0830s0027 [Sinapis alba]
MASSSSTGQHLDSIMTDLAYEDKNLVYKHVTEALIRYPEIHPKVATDTNLLELVVAVDYCYRGKNCRHFVNIYPQASYPKDCSPLLLMLVYHYLMNRWG